MELRGEKLEEALEAAIHKITGEPVSVAVLGPEISVNINGVLHHFIVSDSEETT